MIQNQFDNFIITLSVNILNTNLGTYECIHLSKKLSIIYELKLSKKTNQVLTRNLNWTEQDTNLFTANYSTFTFINNIKTVETIHLQMKD